MSSQRYQEFIAERARLLERIKELEAENAELRKRLGEPVATVSSASCAMKNLSFSTAVLDPTLYFHLPVRSIFLTPVET